VEASSAGEGLPETSRPCPLLCPRGGLTDEGRALSFALGGLTDRGRALSCALGNLTDIGQVSCTLEDLTDTGRVLYSGFLPVLSSPVIFATVQNK
jgi:hypothetical protein